MLKLHLTMETTKWKSDEENEIEDDDEIEEEDSDDSIGPTFGNYYNDLDDRSNDDSINDDKVMSI